MKLISLTYTKKAQFQTPDSWFYRTQAYMGVLETLGRRTTVISIDRISFHGNITRNGILHIFPDYNGSRLTVATKLNHLTAVQRPDVVLVQGMIFPVQVI